MPPTKSDPPLLSLAIKAGLALHRARATHPYQVTARDHAEQLQSPWAQTLALVTTAMLIAAWIALPTANMIELASWLGISLAITAIRMFHSHRVLRKPRRRPELGNKRDWEGAVNMHLCLLAASGVAWGAYSVLFMHSLDTFDRITILVLLAFIAAALVMRVSIVSWFSNLVSVVVLAPAALVLLLDTAKTAQLGWLTLWYLAALIVWARMNRRRVIATVSAARMNDKLVLDAVRQQKKVEMLNAELRDAQNSMLQLNQQLEERVRQRTSLLRKEISEREGYQKRLEALASSDPLTGLANRSRLASSIALALDSALDDGSRVAVYFIDLDRFKEVNDGMGHYTGDRVLEIVSSRLVEIAPLASCVARWGGDEFVIVQPAGTGGDDILESFAQTIVQTLSNPIRIGNSSATIGASIGIAVFPEHGQDPESLVKHADLAVYQAKLDGRGCVKVFRPDWQRKARERIQMVQALKEAIESDALTLNYQPILDPLTGVVSTMEALLRWRHSEFGIVSPAVFVALAEESGLMVSLGNWVLRRACLDARRIVGENCLRVAVNVSAHQFAHGDFIEVLENALDESGLDPRNLELELTETVYAHDANTVRETLQAIRQRGVSIAIDDFGTGYSSLAYLQRFPVDVLKVDRSFVRDIETGGDTIIAAVSSLARSLGVRVVVEGIETVEELVRVRGLGADQVQGFLFAKPMVLDVGVDWLEANAASAFRVPEPVLEIPGITAAVTERV